MSAGQDGADKEWEDFYKWCRSHEDIPMVESLLACMTILSAVDRSSTPKTVVKAANKVYLWLMTEVERIREPGSDDE